MKESQVRLASNAPEDVVDFGGEMPAIPADFEPEIPSDEDLEKVQKLMFTRKLVDPVLDWEFEANDMRDMYRYGWFRTNLGISIGKKKKVGEYEFDAGLLPPIISPASLFTGSDYKESKHSLRFFLMTKVNEGEAIRLPKYLKAWHKDDIPILQTKFKNAKYYLQTRAPSELPEDYNIFKHNRHPIEVQQIHHCAALTWQLLQTFEHNDGFAAAEIDSWTFMAYIEIAYGGGEKGWGVNRDLLEFIVWRMENAVNVDDFGSRGYQDYMLRYVFLSYYLGRCDDAWDAACGISKLRGTEFTKSPLYDYVLEMRDDPEKFSEMFEEDPAELLTYFRM